MFSFTKKDKSAGGFDFVIAGLGNPGDKYAFTRHNVGFMFIDRLAEKYGIKVKKLRYKSLYGEGVIGGKRCMLVKPQTFMNNSGESLGEIVRFYKIKPEQLIVIYDDITLVPGKLRIRHKGSAGGHNGMKSIIAHVGSEEFPRIRIGIGEKPHPEMDLADWVLSSIKKDEKALAEGVDNAACALELIVKGDFDSAMNKYN